MFAAAKDALVSRAVRRWLNTHLARYGHVECLQIDSRRKTIEFTCRLDGESAPVTVTISNYVVETEGDQTYIRATNFQCTRAWLQTLLAEFCTARRFKLPRLVAATL